MENMRMPKNSMTWDWYLSNDQGTVCDHFFELIFLLFKKMLLYLHCQSIKHQRKIGDGSE